MVNLVWLENRASRVGRECKQNGDKHLISMCQLWKIGLGTEDGWTSFPGKGFRLQLDLRLCRRLIFGCISRGGWAIHLQLSLNYKCELSSNDGMLKTLAFWWCETVWNRQLHQPSIKTCQVTHDTIKSFSAKKHLAPKCVASSLFLPLLST